METNEDTKNESLFINANILFKQLSGRSNIFADFEPDPNSVNKIYEKYKSLMDSKINTIDSNKKEKNLKLASEAINSLIFGRRGTGKTTLACKAYFEKLANNQIIPIYIDINGIFDEDNLIDNIDNIRKKFYISLFEHIKKSLDIYMGLKSLKNQKKISKDLKEKIDTFKTDLSDINNLETALNNIKNKCIIIYIDEISEFFIKKHEISN